MDRGRRRLIRNVASLGLSGLLAESRPSVSHENSNGSIPFCIVNRLRRRILGSLALAAAAHGAIDRNVVGDRHAYFVDRILRGARPKDLPVEDTTDLQLVINLGAAEAIGLEVPPALRLQATRLIK